MTLQTGAYLNLALAGAEQTTEQTLFGLLHVDRRHVRDGNTGVHVSRGKLEQQTSGNGQERESWFAILDKTIMILAKHEQTYHGQIAGAEPYLLLSLTNNQKR